MQEAIPTCKLPSKSDHYIKTLTCQRFTHPADRIKTRYKHPCEQPKYQERTNNWIQKKEKKRLKTYQEAITNIPWKNETPKRERDQTHEISYKNRTNRQENQNPTHLLKSEWRHQVPTER